MNMKILSNMINLVATYYAAVAAEAYRTEAKFDAKKVVTNCLMADAVGFRNISCCNTKYEENFTCFELLVHSVVSSTSRGRKLVFDSGNRY